MDASREGQQRPQEAGSQADKEPVPQLGPEQQRLEVLVGEWRGEGLLGEASGPDTRARATTEERYEWLPGGFFLTGRGVMHFGDKHLESTRVLGFDPASQRYRLYQFDDMGYARVYEGEETQDGVWTFTGPYERMKMTFGDGNHSVDVHWEQLEDDGTWKTLCDLKTTRVQ
jgi:hypothetical protein